MNFKNENFINVPEKIPPEKLVEGMKYTGDVWKINKAKGVKFNYVDGTWIGYSHSDEKGKGIVLGSGPTPEDFKKSLNLPPNMPELEVKRYVFSHENMHHVLFEIEEHTKENTEFINFVKKIRVEKKRGLSRLGSHPFYEYKEGDEVRRDFQEDIVELLNMYAQNPQMLEDYLKYLNTSNPLAENNIKSNGQVIIGDTTEKYIYKNIERIVVEFLEKNKNLIN